MIILKLKTVSGLRWSVIFSISFVIVYISITQLSKASLYGVFNIFTVDFTDHSYDNTPETNDIHHPTPSHLLLLEQFTTRQWEFSTAQLKIFFLQTSENQDILSRHACSIESAARLHPAGLIFVLMRSTHVHLRKGSFDRLRRYTNIRFVHFNEDDVYSGITLSRLNQTKRTQFIRYFTISHMSDFIRTALLYKYGGIYFDLDVIPLRTFTSFANTVGLESEDGVNVAVLVFEKQHLVLDIQMDMQIMSVETPLNALCWNCVGPSALSDALKQVCDEKKLQIHSKDQCHQVDIQPSFVFYPIPYQKIPQFFRRSQSSADVDDLVNNSSIYSIHYFHHMTMNLAVEHLSPFARIAQTYCPYVFEQLIDRREFSLQGSKTPKYVLGNSHILLFCLTISFLCAILILLFTGTTCFSYASPIRVILIGLQHRFHISL